MSARKRKLTKRQQKVIAQIQRFYRLDKPLNISAVRKSHPELLAEAYKIKPFWGWKRALEDAGIRYSDIRIELLDYVVCRLCGEERMRLPLHLTVTHECDCEDYLLDYPDAELVCERMRARMMGVTMTGESAKHLVMPHWEPVWSAEYVLDRIAEFRRRGMNLNYAAIKEISILARAYKYFGSWDNALKHISLVSEEIRLRQPPRFHNRSSVLSEIKRRNKAGLELAASKVTNGEGKDRTLYKNAVRLFGNWGAAVEAAGLPYDQVRLRKPPKYTPNSPSKMRKTILSEIRLRREKGLALTATAMKAGQNRDPTLYTHARHVFGNWKAAVESAGLQYQRLSPNPTPAKYREPKAIIQEIRHRKKLGLALSAWALSKGPDRDSRLYKQGCNIFGTWRTAIEAAELKYEAISRYRTGRFNHSSPQELRRTVIQEIRLRKKQRLPLTTKELRKGPTKDPTLYGYGHQLFGTWQSAVRAAGVNYHNLKRQ